MDESKVCCFTGHRLQNLPFQFREQDERCWRLKQVLCSEIEKQIRENNVKHFISGMAIGVDMYAAEIVLALKGKYPDLTLEAAIPCESQSVKWSAQLQKRYTAILSRCDVKTLLQSQYTSDCMQKRNRYMADRADIVIAVWNGKPSGTGKTVSYAKELGKPVVIINPETL